MNGNTLRRATAFTTSAALLAALTVGTLAAPVVANGDNVISPTAYATVVDGACSGMSPPPPRDGTPDCVLGGFFAVLNRVPPGQEERAIVEFDVSGLLFPQSSARFSGSPFYNTTGPATLELWGYVGDGSVSNPDFDSGANFIATFNHSSGPLSLDVLSFVNKRAAQGDKYVGFAIRQPNQKAGRKSWVSLKLTTSPPSPLKSVRHLSGDVANLDVARGVRNALGASLDVAVSKLADSSTRNDKAAVGQLRAFVNKVEAQAGKKIAVAAAKNLVAKAEHVIDRLK